MLMNEMTVLLEYIIPLKPFHRWTISVISSKSNEVEPHSFMWLIIPYASKVPIIPEYSHKIYDQLFSISIIMPAYKVQA